MQAKYDPTVNDHTPEIALAAKQVAIAAEEVPQGSQEYDASETYASDFNFLPKMDALGHMATPSSSNLNGKTSPDTCNDSRITRASLDKARREPTAELLRMHNKFGHVSFSRLRAMARNGVLPKGLADCPIPSCPSCLYGKAKRRPTQTKAKKSVNPAGKVLGPGDCVSVDILVSKTPGLIAQMTTRRYQYACVFVDHFSGFTYVHLLKAQDGDEVLAAKATFEATADTHGIRIKHYHADNGIFAGKQWLDSCRDSHQGVTFAGVDSHHQNGRTERKIQSLQELGRCQLLHAAHRWESVALCCPARSSDSQ
jgi:hypothetical protein